MGKRTGGSRNHSYHANFSPRHRSSAFGMSVTETQGICCPTTSVQEVNLITEFQTTNQVEVLRHKSAFPLGLHYFLLFQGALRALRSEEECRCDNYAL